MPTTISHRAIIRTWNSNQRSDIFPFQNCTDVLNLFIRTRSSDWVYSRNNLKLAKALVADIQKINYNSADPESVLNAINDVLDCIKNRQCTIENPSNNSCLAAMCAYLIENLHSAKNTQNYIIKALQSAHIDLDKQALCQEQEKAKATYEKQIQLLESQNVQLLRHNQTLQTQIQQEVQEKQTLETSLHKIEESYKKASAEKEQLEKEKQQHIIVQRKTTTKREKQVKAENEKLKQEIIKLTQEIECHKQTIEKKAQDMIEIYALQSDTEAGKTQEILKLKDQVTAIKKASIEKIKRLNEELQNLTTELSQLTKNHQSVLTEKRQYEEACTNMQKELEGLKLYIRKQDSTTTTSKKLLDENTALTEQINQMTQANAKLAERNKQLEKSHSILTRLIKFLKENYGRFFPVVKIREPGLSNEIDQYLAADIPPMIPPHLESPAKSSFFSSLFGGGSPTRTPERRESVTPT